MEDPPMDSQVGMDISIFRDLDWDHHWGKKLDINWEAPLI